MERVTPSAAEVPTSIEVESEESVSQKTESDDSEFEKLESEEPITTPIETQPFSDEHWDLSTKFPIMLTRVAELLDRLCNRSNLRLFLKSFCPPHTNQPYVDEEPLKYFGSTLQMIEHLVPQYINQQNTRLLRVIVDRYGNEECKTLLKEYEDNFLHKKPLKRMFDPISDEELRTCSGDKRIKVKYGGGLDTTTVEDVEMVQQNISRNTEVDESMTAYANQTPATDPWDGEDIVVIQI